MPFLFGLDYIFWCQVFEKCSRETIPALAEDARAGFPHEAGVPGWWEFTALFRLRFGGVGWWAVRRSLANFLLSEIVWAEAKTFQAEE